MNFTPFGLIHLTHSTQIEGVGNQGVKRVGWHRNHTPSANCGGGPIQSFRCGLERIDLDQVGGHVGKRNTRAGFRFRLRRNRSGCVSADDRFERRFLIARLKRITESADGMDQPGRRRILLDFLPQAQDVDVDGTVGNGSVLPPHGV